METHIPFPLTQLPGKGLQGEQTQIIRLFNLYFVLYRSGLLKKPNKKMQGSSDSPPLQGNASIRLLYTLECTSSFRMICNLSMKRQSMQNEETGIPAFSIGLFILFGTVTLRLFLSFHSLWHIRNRRFSAHPMMHVLCSGPGRRGAATQSTGFYGAAIKLHKQILPSSCNAIKMYHKSLQNVQTQEPADMQPNLLKGLPLSPEIFKNELL